MLIKVNYTVFTYYYLLVTIVFLCKGCKTEWRRDNSLTVLCVSIICVLPNSLEVSGCALLLKSIITDILSLLPKTIIC